MIDSQEQKLRALINAHARHVSWLIARRERDPMTREELLADVFEIAYRHLAELSSLPPAVVRSWLLRTATNVTANEARRGAARRRLIQRLSSETPPVVPSPEDQAVAEANRRELHRRLGATFEQMTPAHQSLLARDAVGQNGPAIAADLGISHQAARSRLMRARSAFARRYHAGTEVSGDRSRPTE